jgi:hypothetical protein
MRKYIKTKRGNSWEAQHTTPNPGLPMHIQVWARFEGGVTISDYFTAEEAREFAKRLVESAEEVERGPEEIMRELFDKVKENNDHSI